MRARAQAKSANLAHFLPAAASLGYRALGEFGACQLLPRCGKLVPVLRQVRASGIPPHFKVRGFNVDFSRTLLVMTAVVSATGAHVDCYIQASKICDHATTRLGDDDHGRYPSFQ